MKKKHILILFAIVALIQLFVPLQMIFGKENIINNGTKYKFKTRPVDPTDPYRGKYITLNYKETSFKTKDTSWFTNDDIYVKIKTDSLGFAKIDEVGKEPFIVIM